MIVDTIIATGIFFVVMSVIFFIVLPLCVLGMIPVIGDPFVYLAELLVHKILER